MDYLFQAILLVCVLTCVLMVEAFWSGLHSERSLSYTLTKSILTGGGFLVYAVIDYLLIIPGTNFMMT